jgi:hypothetical protein
VGPGEGSGKMGGMIEICYPAVHDRARRAVRVDESTGTRSPRRKS